MLDFKNGSKCLASLAVFRGLYNSKKDIYGVISEFLKEIIIENSKHQFSLFEITGILNETYEFKIPEAIIQTALKRLDFIEKKNGSYIANNIATIEHSEINKSQQEIELSNNHIIEKLFGYISEKQAKELTRKDKDDIVHSFSSFLLDDSNGAKYCEFISAFIIENKSDIDFTKQLNLIKEGIVLYSGIKYNLNLNNLGSWSTPLTIYIETEILFHFAGFNGKLFKTLFDDFFSYVKEINSKSKIKLIQLRYFTEVKYEIERFFKKAEFIVDGKEKANPSVTAMKTITDGCETPADVIEKKSKFFDLLQINGIKEDYYNDYYNKQNYQYNIITQELIDKLTTELGLSDIQKNIQFLNFINIHRKKEFNNNFENIKFILLSGNSNTLKIAWHNDIKSQGNVPLATNLNFLTNKFWFKLNKGFGSNNFPTTFNVVTKAQVILATQLNESVNKKYDEFKDQFRTGKLTEKQAILTISNLRKQAIKPEDIKSDDINSILDSISENSISSFLEQQEILENNAKQKTKENNKLKQTIQSKEEIIRREETEKINKEKELLENKIQLNTDLLVEKERNKKSLYNQKKPLDRDALRKYNSFKIMLGVIFISYYIISYFLIWKMTWNFMEQWTYILNGTLPIIISGLYLLLFEKNFNPKVYLLKKKNIYFNNKYKQYNFDLKRFKELDNEIDILRKKLEGFKACR